ncbi:DUF3127 domain-containing protein [Halosquirtibacter xylanolyticus]|uniref:DUF3127 domain-containing protein n=1 Tax=Halosquirtibacter xylanolyticus TaxID=3374599 RepID=UPI0037484A23|nr:DUF3127 domain-containing protein [Prolixibacteraceae bacterium]
MSFTVKGKLEKILDEVSGTSARGEWKKREFVLTTQDEQYPRTICFTLFNDKVSLIEGFQSGQDLEVSFSVESREYQGRYFHNVNAWRVQPAMADAPGAPQGTVPQFDPNAYAAPVSNAGGNSAPAAGGDSDDDLPF